MHLRIFPSLLIHPEKISFVDQEADERIELFLRQHWITNIPWMFITVIAAIIPSSLIDIANTFLPIPLSVVPQNIISASLTLWYLGVIAYAVEKFLHWYFNIYIVTNKHLVDVNFYNLLNREVTEIRLTDIQSQSADIRGIIRSIFNFGDVVIESAAERQKITFLSVPRPDLVRDKIQDLREVSPHEGGGV